GSGSGTCCSPMISSSTRSSRPSLLPTCQYSDAAPTPSSSPSRRMLSAASPSRSSRSTAAFTIASRLIGSRRRRDGRAGRRWLAAIVLIVGALMDMIDVTIVNVALPSIRRDLHASATQLEWVVSGYMLAFAATLIIAGNLGDKFGRKRVFLAGAALFGLASLAAGLSGSGAELIAARVIQGVAAATMAPQVLATFRVIFGREERGKAFGIYGAMLGFASAIGLVLGGVLTDANLFGWGWRSVFYVNVPVAVAALIAGARLVPETRDPAARRPNLPGAVLLAGSLVAIVYPLLEGRQLGWPAWVWPLMAAGVGGLVVLALIEARRSSRSGQGVA